MSSRHSIVKNATTTSSASDEVSSKLSKALSASSKLGSMLVRYIRTGRRFLLVGPPGCAKTSLILAAAQETGHDVVITAAGTRERVDFSGAMFPDMAAGFAKELPLETMHRLINATRPTIWYLDDLGNADIDVQAAVKAAITSGGIISNNPNIFVCGATNRPGDKTGVRAIHESLKSEFNLAFEMPMPDAEENPNTVYLGTWKDFVDGWVDWAWDYSKAREGEIPEIIAWIRNTAYRAKDQGGSTLYNWHPDANPAHRSADCRTWKSVIDMWVDGIRDMTSVSAAIGKQAAADYMAFASLTHGLPTADQIKMDPSGAMVPTDPAALFLICAIVASAVEPDWLDEAAVYLERLPRVYQALLMRDLYRRHTSVIAGTKKFVQLFLANKALFNANQD